MFVEAMLFFLSYDYQTFTKKNFVRHDDPIQIIMVSPVPLFVSVIFVRVKQTEKRLEQTRHDIPRLGFAGVYVLHFKAATLEHELELEE
jgi:hypothetical protein